MKRRAWSVALAAAALAATALAADQSGAPAAAGDPYQIATVCTAMPVNIGRRVAASNGSELQHALDTASAGDTILLAAGTTFTPVSRDGSFVLRNRQLARGQWIIVRSASTAFDPGGEIPPHTRVTDGNASQMPRIRTASVNAPAFRTDPGARGYRLIGLDIAPDDGLRQVTNLVVLGDGSDASIDTEPSDIVIDRSYIHGNDSGNFRRGVMMNGANLAVIDSYLANFHDENGDSQALGGSNGPGPFKIVNNFLEAASENILFGGSDPKVPGLVPSDIEVRRNLSTKRLAWRDAHLPVKNAFELKNARRVLVEGNVFEHVWVSGQDGTAILLKSVNQGGACTWCVTEYVTFRDNIVRGAANGLSINATERGRSGVPLPLKANHIRVSNVLFDDIGSAEWGKGGKLLRVFGGVSDASFVHITSRGNAIGILDAASATDLNPGLVFTDNIVERKNYGIGAGSDEGTKTLSRNFAPYVYDHNVIVNTSADSDQAIDNARLEARYPKGTWVVSGWNDVGFQAGTSKLTATSRFAHAAADGKDVGADMDAIAAAARISPRSADGCGEASAIPRKQ